MRGYRILAGTKTREEEGGKFKKEGRQEKLCSTEHLLLQFRNNSLIQSALILLFHLMFLFLL